MVLAIRNDFITEHGANWVIFNVIRNKGSASEDLCRQMLIVTKVDQNTIFLSDEKCDCDVGFWLHIQWLQLHKGDIVQETQTGKVLAALAAVAWSTLADIVIAARDVHADSMFAVVLLTG